MVGMPVHLDLAGTGFDLRGALCVASTAAGIVKLGACVVERSGDGPGWMRLGVVERLSD